MFIASFFGLIGIGLFRRFGRLVEVLLLGNVLEVWEELFRLLGEIVLVAPGLLLLRVLLLEALIIIVLKMMILKRFTSGSPLHHHLLHGLAPELSLEVREGLLGLEALLVSGGVLVETPGDVLLLHVHHAELGRILLKVAVLELGLLVQVSEGVLVMERLGRVLLSAEVFLLVLVALLVELGRKLRIMTKRGIHH